MVPQDLMEQPGELVHQGERELQDPKDRRVQLVLQELWVLLVIRDHRGHLERTVSRVCLDPTVYQEQQEPMVNQVQLVKQDQVAMSEPQDLPDLRERWVLMVNQDQMGQQELQDRQELEDQQGDQEPREQLVQRGPLEQWGLLALMGSLVQVDNKVRLVLLDKLVLEVSLVH